MFEILGAEGQRLQDVQVFDGEKRLAWEGPEVALALDPGTHELRFDAPGHQVRDFHLVLPPADQGRTVQVHLISDDKPSVVAAVQSVSAHESTAAVVQQERDWSEGLVVPLVLAGTSVVGLGAFAYFGLEGRAEYDRLQQEDGCAPTCSKSQVAAGRRSYIIADVALGVSIASAVAAGVLWLMHDGPPSAAPELAWQGPGQWGVRAEF